MIAVRLRLTEDRARKALTERIAKGPGASQEVYAASRMFDGVESRRT